MLTLNDVHRRILKMVLIELEKKDDWICHLVSNIGQDIEREPEANDIVNAVRVALGDNKWLTGWVVEQQFTLFEQIWHSKL